MNFNTSHHPSFNEEFCTNLDYTLCAVLSISEDQEFRRYRCDGVSWAPFYNAEVNKEYLSFENVKERGFIETTANVGVGGQDRHSLKIVLGENALMKYQKNEPILDCIP